MIQFKTILRAARPFLGGVTVTVDRSRQRILFTRNGETTILTIDQLFDQIEETFSKAKRETPDPVPAHQERKEAPWLADNGQKPKQLF
jgi:hypothetical protein